MGSLIRVGLCWYVATHREGLLEPTTYPAYTLITKEGENHGNHYQVEGYVFTGADNNSLGPGNLHKGKGTAVENLLIDLGHSV